MEKHSENSTNNPHSFNAAQTPQLKPQHLLRNPRTLHNINPSKPETLLNKNNTFYITTNPFINGTQPKHKKTQNKIWLTNYGLKMSINKLREENSSVKAKLWNLEKENRKMDKQIENWNLGKVFIGLNSKPYIDMGTVLKVFADQDYEIASIKISTSNLTNELSFLQTELEDLESLLLSKQNFNKEVTKLQYETSKEKNKLLNNYRLEMMCSDNEQVFMKLIEKIEKELTQSVVNVNENAEILAKRVEIQKKANATHIEEGDNLQKERTGTKGIDEMEIDRIKAEVRRIKLQEQNEIKNITKSIKKLKKTHQEYESEMQDQMDSTITSKIMLNKQIEEMTSRIMLELGSCPIFEKEIQPILEQIHQKEL